MTAGTVVITGGILATVILLCIIAVLCYCRLQYYCCKKDDPNDEEEEEEEEEEESDLPTHSHPGTCNACSSRMADGQGSPTPIPELNQHGAHPRCPTCSPYGSPFYIRTPDMVRNGGERVAYAPACYPEMGPPVGLQGFPLSRHSFREGFPPSRAISTDV
ncbi:protein FAM163A [Phasianus colchicus]|uniref:Family with sequence similarity 163 member A n=1 Tax=Chrysolophus pictus TaxID=9089 RepID=A0A8C3KWJ9_CHRPC|nr:protein FAM163A [Phasianus colchicus]XP_031451465.1 protein FAM163A [Phasianus colchicus]